MEQKWIKNKKEFVKLHIAVDAKSKKIVSFRVTKGNVHDSEKLGPMIKEVAEALSNLPSANVDVSEASGSFIREWRLPTRIKVFEMSISMNAVHRCSDKNIDRFVIL